MSRYRESLADFLTKAEPSLQLILQDENAKGWGPVVRTQFDSQSEPIQTYTSALLRTSTARWIVVCCITDVGESHPAPPQVTHLSQPSAIGWLKANGFRVPEDHKSGEGCGPRKPSDDSHPSFIDRHASGPLANTVQFCKLALS